MTNFCEDLFFFFGDRLNNFSEDLFFFWRALALVSLALASSIPVLGLESVCPRKGCPWPWPRIFFVSLALASSLVSSTPPLCFTALIIIDMSAVFDTIDHNILLHRLSHHFGINNSVLSWFRPI